MGKRTYSDPKRQKSADRMERRIAALDPTQVAGRCPLWRCGRPTAAKAGHGLSDHHCRYHLQYRNRHGSLWKGTYTKTDLKPYRAAVISYLRASAHHGEVEGALRALDLLMLASGQPRHPADAHTMRPETKARSALARMREAEIPAMKLLVNHLAITAAVREDPIGPGGEPDEYRLVQIAKACIRLASGHHYERSDGSKISTYPRSSGLVLRILGKMIDEACGFFARKHLAGILELKRPL